MEQLDIIAWRAFHINQQVDGTFLQSPYYHHKFFQLLGTNTIEESESLFENIDHYEMFVTKHFNEDCKEHNSYFNRLNSVYTVHPLTNDLHGKIVWNRRIKGYHVNPQTWKIIDKPKCKCFSVKEIKKKSTSGFYTMYTLGMIISYVHGLGNPSLPEQWYGYWDYKINDRWVDIQDIPRDFNPNVRLSQYRKPTFWVYAPCLLHGTVIEHKLGFRAEKLDILGLYSFGNHNLRRIWSHKLGYDIRSVWDAPKLPTYRKGSTS